MNFTGNFLLFAFPFASNPATACWHKLNFFLETFDWKRLAKSWKDQSSPRFAKASNSLKFAGKSPNGNFPVTFSNSNLFANTRRLTQFFTRNQISEAFSNCHFRIRTGIGKQLRWTQPFVLGTPIGVTEVLLLFTTESLGKRDQLPPNHLTASSQQIALV